MTGVLIKRKNLDPETYAEGRQCEDMQGEDSHVIASVCKLRRARGCPRTAEAGRDREACFSSTFTETPPTPQFQTAGL